MPVEKLRHDYPPASPVAAAPRLTTDLDGVTAAPSPARLLQEQLAQGAAAARLPVEEKWSPRRSLAFIVTTSAALWMAILMVGAQTVKLVA
jgi:hypothetical protein